MAKKDVVKRIEDLIGNKFASADVEEEDALDAYTYLATKYPDPAAFKAQVEGGRLRRPPAAGGQTAPRRSPHSLPSRPLRAPLTSEASPFILPGARASVAWLSCRTALSKAWNTV